MRNNTGLAVILIFAGAYLLLKSANLIPDHLAGWYLQLFYRYWPALLILWGLRVLFRDSLPVLSDICKWVTIIFLVGWLVSLASGQREWVTFWTRNNS